MNAANRVALNTGILYGRMLITMGITLYSTRLVLNALGSTDYGIFNLLAGIILMLSFLNTAMATSTQRYLSYHQGKNDVEMQKKVFTNSLTLHIAIGLLIVLGLETAGLFLFDGFLNIPSARVDAARTIYHFMSLTVFFTIIAVPFNGSLVAHENMFWVAFVNIIETLLKLAIAIVLYTVAGDKLIVYGLLTAGITVISFTLYAIYCFKKYPDCTLQGITKPEKGMIKELGSFAGWNLFGSLCSLGRTQGLALILNLFFGTVVNAAYGIANQVGSQLLFFSSTMLRALNPQIMKSEGAGDRDRMLRLSMMASKFGFFLLAIFAIPCIFEMRGILSFWLKNVPEYTIMFCQLVLVGALTNQLTIGLQSAMQAQGEIKVYQVVVGGLLLLNLPIAYLLLKAGLPPFSVMISYICVEFVACMFRLIMSRKLLSLNIALYIRNVFQKEWLPVFISCLTCYAVATIVGEEHFRFLLTGILSGVIFIVTVFYFGLIDREKQLVLEMVSKVKKKALRSS